MPGFPGPFISKGREEREMFIEFTAEQKQQANEVDLVALLERNGQQVSKVGLK